MPDAPSASPPPVSVQPSANDAGLGAAPTGLASLVGSPLACVVSSGGTACESMLARRGFAVRRITEPDSMTGVRRGSAPDIVFVDACLVAADEGLVARIKGAWEDAFVPVVALVPVNDAAAMDLSLQRGADDCVAALLNEHVLDAKLRTLMRLRQLHAEVQAQRRYLATHHQQQAEEFQVAEKLFASILDREVLSWPMFKHVHSPIAVFNGDLLLAAPVPDGGLRVLIGDFTGHGLVASIGTVPVAEVFYGMTEKGFSVAELLTEMNSKVRHLLPVGRFLAAAVVQLDAAHRNLSVWNGGLPDVLVYDAAQRALRARAPSLNLPLGVVPSDQMDTACERFDVQTGDRVFACSDGLLETRGRGGVMFGTERLEACFSDGLAAEDLFARIESAVSAHRDGRAQEDDLTFVEVQCGMFEGTAAYRQGFSASRAPSTWTAEFRFAADSLREADPLPLITHFIQEHQGLRQHRERIFVVLSELYNNALEHGLLQLDSRLKDGPDGFMDYFEERERRLAALASGEIAVMIHNEPHAGGGRLAIHVTDTGRGFDVAGAQPGQDGGALHGRGLRLVRSLVNRLDFNASGTEARAVYTWD